MTGKQEEQLFKLLTDILWTLKKMKKDKVIRAKKFQTMRRLIYDMYYADEISVEIAERLLDKLEQVRNKRRRY